MKKEKNPGDKKWMKRALDIAVKGLGHVGSNPMVGAVIVKDNRVVGEGYHEKYGSFHAEINALKQAGNQARGADLYVTLEPCNHFGKTPPCTQAVLDAGISRVFIGVRDPNPVAMGGMEFLEKNGILCFCGLLEQECRELNPFFFAVKTTILDRPWITLKLAMTLNGKIARKDRTSRWISCEKSREFTHVLRRGHQGIFCGVNTLIYDNPRLNSRLEDELDRDVLVLDPRGRVPASAQVFLSHSVFYFSAMPRPDLPFHVKRFDCPLQNYEKIWILALDKLRKNGVESLFVEGGAQVASFLLEKKLVDRLLLFYGPKIFLSDGIEGLNLNNETELIIDRVFPVGNSFVVDARSK